MKDMSAADYSVYTTFVATMRRHCQSGDAMVAAVSGGSDSMALLELLALAIGRGQLSLEVTVAYVDHRLRSQAHEERRAVAEAASGHQLDFVGLRIDDLAASDEATLRAERYRVLEGLADRLGATAIATGHTRDDQIETVLFRFLRGAGRRGLGGMRVRRDRILRPLLGASRAQLRALLRSRATTWLEDASNTDPRYARNRLRLGVIPAIDSEFGEDALAHIPDFAARWAVEDDYLENEAKRFAAYVVSGGGREATVNLMALAEVPAAIQTRILRAWLREVSGGSEPSMAKLASLEGLVLSSEGSRSAQIAGTHITREYSRLSAGERCAVSEPFCYRVGQRCAAEFVDPAGRWRVHVDPAPQGRARAAASPRRQQLDLNAAALPEQLLLRPLRPGDVIETSEHGRKKVHGIMLDFGLPRRERPNWPVLSSGARVIWVPGIAVAAGALADERAPRRLRFSWNRIP